MAHIYALIAQSERIITNPDVFYLKAATMLMDAERLNCFESDTESNAEIIVNYLETAGFQKEAEQIRLANK